jgi:hypothetical protein
MKNATKLMTAVLAITALAAASPALAVNLLGEPFSYPDGGIVAVSGGNWANHSGTGTDITIVSGTAQGDMLNAPDDNRTFAAQGVAAKTFACFKVTIPNPGAGTVSTNYFAHFKDTGTSNFMARVFVAPQGATFAFGITAGSSTTPTVWPTALNYGQSYYVVIDYDAAAGTSDLWVDPTVESDPKVSSSLPAGATGIAVSAFALRESSTQTPAGSLRWKFIVDDLGVGTTFSDACYSGPTPTKGSTWGRLKAIYR